MVCIVRKLVFVSIKKRPCVDHIPLEWYTRFLLINRLRGRESGISRRRIFWRSITSLFWRLIMKSKMPVPIVNHNHVGQYNQLILVLSIVRGRQAPFVRLSDGKWPSRGMVALWRQFLLWPPPYFAPDRRCSLL